MGRFDINCSEELNVDVVVALLGLSRAPWSLPMSISKQSDWGGCVRLKSNA